MNIKCINVNQEREHRTLRAIQELSYVCIHVNQTAICVRTNEQRTLTAYPRFHAYPCQTNRPLTDSHSRRRGDRLLELVVIREQEQPGRVEVQPANRAEARYTLQYAGGDTRAEIRTQMALATPASKTHSIGWAAGNNLTQGWSSVYKYYIVPAV